MSEPSLHPTPEELSAYSLGQLPQERAVAIDSHISKCQPCCETIVGLSSDDTFVGLLKESRQLPVDQPLDHDSQDSQPSSSHGDIPNELAEHPRYEIVRLIGKGGMGDVYEAIHRKMERRVALKVINRALFQKAEAVNRFHREVKTAAQLSDPNVVTAFDADQAGDFHFMVMEFVDGIDLSHVVKDRGALPIAEACDYVRQAAIGLQHAHERGMVHRDIKPHNLMATADGTIKILDFGLASLAPEALSASDAVAASSDLTAAGAIMGTPDFISPEQAEDARQVDIRSDIYSLEATFYYLLSGQVPFDDGSVMHKLKSHAEVEPLALTSLRDDLPDELIAIVTRMMAKDPNERYLTPSEVAQALESFLQTYRLDETESPMREPSSGGNMSGSEGQASGANDMSPDWIPMLGKWLFYLSLIPIALLILDMFFLSDEASDAADRTMFYIGTSVALSTIGGVLAGIHQFNTGRRDTHRDHKWSEGQTMLIVVILLGAGVFYLAETDNGVVRIAVKDPSLQISILGQTITMEDGVEKPLTITPGEWPLLISKEDVGFRFHTDSFRVRRGDEITFDVEVFNDEVVILKNGEPFDRQEIFDLRDELQDADDRSHVDGKDTKQILNRMTKTYAECKSYTDTGIIETIIRETPDSPNVIIDHSFTTTFVRPDRFRFEIMDQYDDELLISLDGEDVQTSWDTEPGFPKLDSLELAMAQAVGFTGGDVGRIPAMLMPKKLDGWVDLDLIDPIRIEDGKLQNVECFRLEYNFRDEQIILWIDKQSHFVRRIDECIESDGIRISERKTTYDPTIDGKITDEMLRVDPPAPRAADDGANALPNEDLEQLQGDWETVSVTESGKQLATENGFGGLLLQIRGNTFVIAERKPDGENSEVDTGRIEINSTSIPKTIDFIGSAELRLGIYELEDDLLRVCLIEQSGTDAPEEKRVTSSKTLKRPTTFESPAGSNVMLMEFTKNEPAKEDDIPNIQGTWQVTYSEDGGRIAPQEMLKEIRFVIDEQNLTTEVGGRDSVSTYKLDPSTNPKSIDLTENGRTKQAIYDLVGDTLRICIAESGEQRPTAFDSQPNSANDIVLILKRVKPREASSAETDSELHADLLAPELARSLIPKAASIRNEDFQKLQTNPTAKSIKSKSLSLVLLTLDISSQSAEDANDFRFLVEGYPKPSEIAAAMSPSRSKGYFSIIQPDYITECKITNSTDKMVEGKVTFNAPRLYIGSATFEARKHEDAWRIEKFHLPSRKISIVLGEDGNWQLEKKAAEGNQAPSPSDSPQDDRPESSMSNAADVESLPLVQVLNDAEALTAKRVKIIGTFLVTDDKFGVRSYRISTAKEELPHLPEEEVYQDREVTFEASFSEDRILNVGQFHNKRVVATGLIYYFPADSDSPAEVTFMMEGISEYQSKARNTKEPQPFNDNQSLAPSSSQLVEGGRLATNALSGNEFSQLIRQANQPGRGGQLAINELLRREGEGVLDSDQLNDLIELILKHQADRARRWRTEMGDLIEKRWLDGTLDRDIWDKYTAQFLVDMCELKVRPRIVIGLPSGVLVQRNFRDLRCGSGKYIEFLLRETNGVTRVGSTIVGRVDLAGTTQIGHDNSEMSAGNSSALTEQQWEPIKPGRQEITFDVELAILESVGPEANEGLDVFASRKATFETEATFLPAGQSTVNVNVDPAMKDEVERAIALKRVETDPISQPTTSETHFARVVLAVQPRPIDNIFTIVLKDGETEYDAGSVAIVAGDGNNHISVAGIAADLSGKRIDVILRPAPDEAERSIDLVEIWGEEIIFEDVLVQ